MEYNVGHNIDYDHYYPPLYDIYKRPVHYSSEGDFMVTTGEYGILKSLDKLDKSLKLYEREIRPNINEYQYFAKQGETIIELPNTHKISNGDIIKLPGMVNYIKINLYQSSNGAILCRITNFFKNFNSK
jgi:hypothetical protein